MADGVSISRLGVDGQSGEGWAALAAINYVEEDGEDLSTILALVEIDGCWLIVEYVLEGPEAGSRITRAANWSASGIAKTWQRVTGEQLDPANMRTAAAQ